MGSKNTSKPDDRRKTIGIIGENLAAKYLTMAGYKIIQRNWRCKCGEIDVIALDGEYLVFVEVKTRRNSQYAQERLLDTITWRKLKKLKSLTQIYIKFKYRSRMLPRYRVDVLGIILDPQDLHPLHYKLIRGISFE